MTQPITPEEIAARRAAALPEEVIDVFNELIAAAWDGRSATVMQEEAIEEIAIRLGISRQEVFDRHLLDVEPIYRASGWGVCYDKPGYNEAGSPVFIFGRP